jgi:tyrosine-protein kinase Etk/Wzc
MYESGASGPLLFSAIFRQRRLVACFLGVGFVVGLLFALLSPKTYRAQAKVIPAALVESRADLLDVAQLRSAASQLGISVSGSNMDPSFMFPQMLRSRDLLQRLIAREYPLRDGRKIDLMTFLKVKPDTEERRLQRAATGLRRMLKSTYDSRSGVTLINTQMGDPVLAAAFANAAAEELDRFLHDLKARQAGKKAEFISNRLVEVQDQLGEAENALRDFRLRNREIMGSPSLMLDETRRIRDVTVNEQIFITLKTQFEIARIQEVRDLPDIMLLERATPPLLRASPKRSKIMVIAMAISGTLGALAALSIEYRTAIRERFGI